MGDLHRALQSQGAPTWTALTAADLMAESTVTGGGVRRSAVVRRLDTRFQLLMQQTHTGNSRNDAMRIAVAARRRCQRATC
jgi:hypothetical protein